MVAKSAAGLASHMRGSHGDYDPATAAVTSVLASLQADLARLAGDPPAALVALAKQQARQLDVCDSARDLAALGRDFRLTWTAIRAETDDVKAESDDVDDLAARRAARQADAYVVNGS